MIHASQEEIDKFWARIEKPDGDRGCWWLTRQRNSWRYGDVCTIRLGGKSYSAHRAAYILTHGMVAQGLVLRHRCDRWMCVNPSHLIPGTQTENMLDMWARKRAKLDQGILYTYEDEIFLKNLLTHPF